MQPLKEVVRIAAIGDIHYRIAQKDDFRHLWTHIGACADLLLLCGDIIDTGTTAEAQAFSRDLTASLQLPIIAVLGNHEFEASQPVDVRREFEAAGINILDGEAVELLGLGIAGVKGFAGGFGKHALQPWGESALKQFVHEAVDESLKLESALAKLRASQRIAVMHYSPVRDTVQGEPPEIFAFLGSSRLEEPLNRFSVSAVFHGHAHRGQPEAKTSTGIPVYNVAMPLLRRIWPDGPPVRIVEINVGDPDPARATTTE